MKDKVTSFIYTGGLLSPIIINKIQKVDEITLNYVQSKYPEFAISFSSVKFTFDCYIIIIRKAKYTFGIGISNEWNNNYEG
jgi:hypothetical protein